MCRRFGCPCPSTRNQDSRVSGLVYLKEFHHYFLGCGSRVGELPRNKLVNTPQIRVGGKRGGVGIGKCANEGHMLMGDGVREVLRTQNCGRKLGG